MSNGGNIKNKRLMVTILIIILMALASSVPFWLDAIHTSKDNNALYGAIFYGLTGIAFLCSFAYLAFELKKINNKSWMLLIFLPMSIYWLSKISGGGFIESKNKMLGAFGEPIMWLLIATLIGHLVLFIYKRNKPQMN